VVKVVVVGSGGVGGYFGGRLARSGHEVALVARGPHLQALQEHGLRVRSVKGDVTVSVPAAEDPSGFGPCDVVLFCVKAFDTEAAAGRLEPVLGPETAVVSLQNGVDNEDRIAAVVGAEHVVGGAAFIFSTISEPGVIAHTGGPARIVFGERDNRRSPRVEQLLAACLDAGIDAAVAPDINAVLWTKFAFICATAGMTASVRLSLGDIRASAPAWAMFRQIVTEVVELARLEGVPLGDEVVDQQVEFAAGLPAESYSSLHHDLTTGRRMELDALHGSVVRRAERFGLAVPACAAVEAVLAPWADRNAHG
jgi:2-dehydropantoate 2-reductase